MIAVMVVVMVGFVFMKVVAWESVVTVILVIAEIMHLLERFKKIVCIKSSPDIRWKCYKNTANN